MKKSGKSALAIRFGAAALSAGALLGAAQSAAAADWSDTSIGYRYGTQFREPFNPEDISKNIFNLTHASGYKYGTNFFNVDFLMSDKKDPQNTGGSGAQEAYLVYRHTLDIGKLAGSDIKFGMVRGVGFTFGFDWNTKNDIGYSSKKRMLVAGPTLMLDVPGFLNVSLLVLDESNAPVGHPNRYTYKTHGMLTAAWGIPFGDSPFSFEGFMNIIAPKGKDEFGGDTKTETNFDGQIMADVGRIAGGPKGVFKLGVEYQYWKNKFGNDAGGAFAKTPMVRAE